MCSSSVNFSSTSQRRALGSVRAARERMSRTSAAGSKARHRACRPVRRRTATASGAGTRERAERSRRGRGGTSAGAAASGGVPQGRGPASAERDATVAPRTARSTIERYADSRGIDRCTAFLGAAPPPVERSKTTARRAADVCRPGRRVARRRTRFRDTTRGAAERPRARGARGRVVHAHVLGPSHDAPRIGVATAARGVRTPKTIKTAPRPPAAAVSAPSTAA